MWLWGESFGAEGDLGEPLAEQLIGTSYQNRRRAQGLGWQD